MNPIVIIGSGLAGYGLAREFRKLDKEQPLLIITADDGQAYSKPMLSNALSKDKTAASLVSADVETMAQQLNAEIRAHARVSAIDPTNKTIEVNGEIVSYQSLVLALGADPFRPPLEGDTQQIISINDLEDYARFRIAIEGKERIVILGGGLIGCEFANDLASKNYKIEMIDRNALPVSTLLPSAVGEQLLSSLQQLGVSWHGGTTVTRVEFLNDQFEVHLDNNKMLTADVVVSAIGLRARTSLAKSAGLQVNKGVVVNRYLQTSAADIYALGDCAEVAGHWLPFIMPLMRCAKSLAQTLAGQATEVSYPAMPVMLKTPAFPIAVLPPPNGTAGTWQIDKSDALRAKFYDIEGKLQGFAFCNEATKEANRCAQDIPPSLG